MRLITLAEIPELPADPATVDSSCTAITKAVKNSVDAAERAATRWAALPISYQTPEAPDAAVLLQPVKATADAWSAALSKAALALREYAEALSYLEREVRSLQEEVPALRRKVKNLEETFRLPSPTGKPSSENEEEITHYQIENSHLRQRCIAANNAITAATEQCAQDLGKISVPMPALPAASTPGNKIPPTDPAAFKDAIGKALLDALIRKAGPDADPTQVADYLAKHPDYLDLVEGTNIDPNTVRQWWQSLDPKVLAALTTGASVVIGGLNGVPPNDRVAANKVNAERQLKNLPDTPENAEQIKYLKSVLAGETKLYLYDPLRQRIIEMVGNPDTATRTITYVPGTFADMNGFYNGSQQSAAKYLVEEGGYRGTPTVAFVYKDGPWANFGSPWSEQSNSNKAWTMDRGTDLTDFEDGMRSDPNLAKAQHVAIGHSAGMSVVSSAEVTGAKYDQVHSYSGSWLADGWKPNDTTKYYHHQNPLDLINVLDVVTYGTQAGLIDNVNTPLTDGTFRKNIHSHTSLTPAEWGAGLLTAPIGGIAVAQVVDGFRNHTGTGGGPESNGPILNETLAEMAGG